MKFVLHKSRLRIVLSHESPMRPASGKTKEYRDLVKRMRERKKD